MRSYTFTFHYENTHVPCVIWLNDDTQSVKNVLFLGTVQVQKLPKWVALMCPPGTAVIQGAPHWHADARGVTIPDFMLQFTKQAFDHLLAVADCTRLHVLADSQAAPGVITLFGLQAYIGYLDRLILLQPLGLSHGSYVGQSVAPVALFKQRVRHNARYQLVPFVTEHKLRYNHFLIAKYTGFDTKKSNAQYAAGLVYNALPELKHLYTLNTVIRVISGAYDKIFPPDEIKEGLERAGVPIEVVVVPKVPHSPLATRDGGRLLRAAFLDVTEKEVC